MRLTNMKFEELTTFKAQGKHWTITEAREATKEEILDYKLNELMKQDKEVLALQLLALQDEKK